MNLTNMLVKEKKTYLRKERTHNSREDPTTDIQCFLRALQLPNSTPPSPYSAPQLQQKPIALLEAMLVPGTPEVMPASKTPEVTQAVKTPVEIPYWTQELISHQDHGPLRPDE